MNCEQIFMQAPVGMCIAIDHVAPIMNATGTYSDARVMRRKSGDLFWCHLTGKAPDHPRAAGAVAWAFEDISEKRPVSAALSPREREIAALLVAGKTSKMIARSS